MNKKAVTTLIAGILLAGGAVAQQVQPASGPERPSINLDAVLVNTDPVPVQSGEDADINLKIRNTGDTEAENVQVQIVDSYPFELKPDRQRNYSLGDVVPGQEYQISTEVLVADNAPDGMNSFKVRIVHGDVSITKNVHIQVQSQDIEMNLANLRTSPSQLTPDMDDASMTVEVVNNGEKTAENVVVNVDLPDSFRKTSSFSTRQAVGNVAPGEIKSAEFRFDTESDAETGSVEIPTNISYSAGDSSTRITEDADFSFYLAGRPQFELVNASSDLQAGSSGELRLTVKNTGAEQASSTRIRVLDSSDQPFSYGSSSKYIGTLEPGQSGTAVFKVTTESGAEAKDYLLDFEIRGVRDTEVYVEDTTVQANVENGERGSGSGPLPIAAVIAVVSAAIIGYVFRDRVRSLLP